MATVQPRQPAPSGNVQHAHHPAGGIRRGLAAVLLALVGITPAPAADEVSFRTNWFPEAEHGGWYQADRDGTFEKYGLDVDMEPGGPQVNNTMLLMGGEADFVLLHSSGQILNAVAEGLPLVAVAAFYQKDPQAIMTHPGVGHDSLEALKGEPILLSQDAHQSFWPWLKKKYGYTDDQVRPYTFQMGPFIKDADTIQQCYITAEPYVVKEAGIDPNLFLLSDHGWRSYSTLVVTRKEIVEENPDLVRRFVAASVEGWYRYFSDPAETNELIDSLTESQTPGQLSYSFNELQERGILVSGDALEMGLGAMTDERWQAVTEQLVGLDLIPADVDPTAGYTTEFVDTDEIHALMEQYPEAAGIAAD